MTDARTEYESAMADNYARFIEKVSEVYGDWRNDDDRAWYNYQVRSGMITIERTSNAQDGDDSNPDATGESGGGPGARHEQPAASEVSDNLGGTSDAQEGSAGTADEGSMPDSRMGYQGTDS